MPPRKRFAICRERGRTDGLFAPPRQIHFAHSSSPTGPDSPTECHLANDLQFLDTGHVLLDYFRRRGKSTSLAQAPPPRLMLQIANRLRGGIQLEHLWPADDHLRRHRPSELQLVSAASS